jgi:hypothetical protein
VGHPELVETSSVPPRSWLCLPADTIEVARALAREPKEIHRWIERFEIEPDAYR